MKKIFIILFISVVITSCLSDEPFNLKYNGFEPKIINDDWQISTPENESVNRAMLQQAYELVYKDDRFTMARSLLVFRNGKLIAEAYPNNSNDIGAIYNIQSCTKSVTSILVGIAIQNNLIGSLDEKLFNVYPEYFDLNIAKRSITIEDALTMRTGLEFDNGEHTLKLYQTEKNSIEYVLSQKRLYTSGSVMNYNDGAPHLISKMIGKKTGITLNEFANQKLFTPLGITDWLWEHSKDGTTFGAFSLYLKPRDFGKIGQLLLQNGMWKNLTIIDSTYLVGTTSTKVSANFNSEPYGYYFWILPASKSYTALGHGGQFLLVAPEKNLVIVYTAWSYTNTKFFDQRNELIEIINNSCN